MNNKKKSSVDLDDDYNLTAIIKHKPNLSRKMIGANWSTFQNALPETAATKSAGEKIRGGGKLKTGGEALKKSTTTIKKHPKENEVIKITHKQQRDNEPDGQLTNCLAIDCEMVGIGSDGQKHMLARVSIVNENGKIVLDKYVKPVETVTDYRTPISGIRPKDIEGGEEFPIVQKEVANVIRGKILIGHALKNDFDVLRINHPRLLIRDTARCTGIKKLVQNKRTPSLKWLAQHLLSETIQEAEHDSVEDARAYENLQKN